MAKARTAYQVAIDNEKWGALSEERQAIIAMKAELSQLKDGKLKVDTSKKQKKGKKNDDKSKDKAGKGAKKEKKKHKETDWKLKGPKPGEPKTKVVNGKTYNWCPYHNDNKGKWVIHKVSECTFNPQNATNAQANQASAEAASSPNTTFAAANMAVAALDSSSDDE